MAQQMPERPDVSTPQADAILDERESAILTLRSVGEIGPVLAGRLVDAFGSVYGVSSASPAELATVDGISEERASKVSSTILNSDIHLTTHEASSAQVIQAKRAEMNRAVDGQHTGRLVVVDADQWAINTPHPSLRLTLEHENDIFGGHWSQLYPQFVQGTGIYADLIEHFGFPLHWSENTPHELVVNRREEIVGSTFEYDYNHGFMMKIGGQYHHI